ncbi:RING finger protein [Aspergillus bombycis]|uniref:RING-type E3 ubiquitin transferase n=1 Tax=Aspergillus bombycis TaxID=109264 RepID=A0A1F7ZWS2_9EURO|nr:RING finger protein [Aspergillus bombycis]OGM43515.1 RING finger protein [Aspergillus bombycis]
MGDSPPALGYLAPICAGILVISVWNQRNSRFMDLESIPFRRGPSVISSGDVDKQFPLMKYSDWWAGRSRKGSIAKETIGSLGSVSQEDPKDKETDINAPEAHVKKTDFAENAPDTQIDKAQEHVCEPGNTCEHDNDDAVSESGCLCAICMDSIEGETYIRPLTCGHIFHSSCVDPWLTRRRASCPLCNKSFGNHGASDREETDAQPFPVLAVPSLPLGLRPKAGNSEVVKFGTEKSTHEARCFVQYWPLTLISCAPLPKLQAGVVIDMPDIFGLRVIRHIRLTQSGAWSFKAFILLESGLLGIQTAN